jgi:DNA repair exonuclease SbcCD ATPase subunit
MTDVAVAAEKPLKIVKLVAENVKKLRAVSITPDGNVVQIAGPNGSGKTSTLNSIWWALAGAGVVQASPIRKGEETATIKLDVGEAADAVEYVITRRFQRTDDGDFTTSIKVTSPDGGQYNKPQQILDGLAGPGGLAFDPLAFARAKAKDQFETLRRFVPGLDFEATDRLNKTDFDKRTTVNREAKEKRAQAHAIEIPEATPRDRIDETAIVDEIAAVGDHNAMIERRKEGRAQVAAQGVGHREDAQRARDKAVELRKQADAQDAQAEASNLLAKECEDRLANAEPLPDPKDAAAIKAKLEEAKRINAAVEQARRRELLIAEAAELERDAEALTAKIDARNEEKRAAIAAAKMPVEGLGFGEDCVTFNGVPFNQASDAEQLRASIAIAMAANPRLKVVLVRDGSLLDRKSMQLLAEMADAHGCQVWVECVNDTGEVGIVMEDGMVVSTPATRAGGKPASAQAAE